LLSPAFAATTRAARSALNAAIPAEEECQCQCRQECELVVSFGRRARFLQLGAMPMLGNGATRASYLPRVFSEAHRHHAIAASHRARHDPARRRPANRMTEKRGTPADRNAG